MSSDTLSTSVIGCFYQLLPVLGQNEAVSYKIVKPSGNTTKNAVPPKVLIHFAAKEYEDIAKATLNKDTMEINRLRKMSAQEACPELRLDTEGDVVAGSMIYVMIPIIQILRIRYGDQFDVNTEYSQEVLESDTEGGTKSVLRSDLVFKHRSQGITIALIEYKRRQIIRYEDYKNAILTSKTTKQKHREKEERSGKNRES
ncbi:hypothetical protein FB567DRAFT_178431 [Paraphoma chrysanthemicola]|uniref:Uncharacterized protein n=1 Tax=Paraphoma chrysanthemicola TaxID=798071 RepID=A0A8K0RI18_9PLEO|nr:hypothetical protein FB567DRAFT_178431 [Paraphoma chrysanthemicola]